MYALYWALLVTGNGIVGRASSRAGLNRAEPEDFLEQTGQAGTRNFSTQ